MKFKHIFNDHYAISSVRMSVAGHSLYMQATHAIDMPFYQHAGKDVYDVSFTIDNTMDMVKCDRRTKILLCKCLKSMWLHLRDYTIEQFGDECGFMCMAYDEDEKGSIRTANYLRMGFVPDYESSEGCVEVILRYQG